MAGGLHFKMGILKVIFEDYRELENRWEGFVVVFEK